MSIRYNEFGEVISVNGITTGHHLGAPMQDAIAERPEDNQQYAIALNTVGNSENVIVDAQPNHSYNSGGGAKVIDMTQFTFDGGTLNDYIVQATLDSLQTGGNLVSMNIEDTDFALRKALHGVVNPVMELSFSEFSAKCYFPMSVITWEGHTCVLGINAISYLTGVKFEVKGLFVWVMSETDTTLVLNVKATPVTA